MGKSDVLSIRILCPFSGVKLKNPETKQDVKAEAHTIPLMKAGNGGFHAFCGPHGVRVFVNSPVMKEMILSVAEVVYHGSKKKDGND